MTTMGIDPPERIPAAPPKKEAQEPRRYMQTIVIASIAVGSILIFLNMMYESETLSGRNAGTSFRKAPKAAHKACSEICTQRRSDLPDMLDFGELIGRVEGARIDLLNKLRKDYGQYWEDIFEDPKTGRFRPVVPLTEDGVSTERLQRKLAIKILSMQSNFRAADSGFRGCDCSAGGNDRAVRPDEVLASLEASNSTTEDPAGDGVYEKYVWVTGGHSASAGHGNLYNETYTSYMEADLVEAFRLIGIEFEARNYAMGGTASATLVSMCWKEIFGEDVDFFAWDYGMVDGHIVAKLLHYGYRGALSPSRPGMMILHYNGRMEQKRLDALRSLQDMGMATFLADEDLQKDMRDAFPDSAGITSAAIDALPDYVRNYKCGEQIEKGDPYCGDDKYTTWVCTHRFKQTSWHPGL